MEKCKMAKFSGIRKLIVVAAASVLLVSPCWGAEGDANTDTEKAKEDLAYSLGVQAYIWGYPIWMNQRSRDALTSVETVAQEGGKAPVNQFFLARSLADHTFRGIKSPNNDTLYSVAYIDLSGEPLVLTFPDIVNRFYTFQFIDAYTNNFHYISSQTRGSIGGKFALVPPGWSGTLPPEMEWIDSPTPELYLLGRILVDGKEDIPNVEMLQKQLSLVPLSKYGQNYEPGPQPVKPPHKYEGPLAFFEELADLVAKNPPRAIDKVLVDQFAPIGLVPRRAFDASRLEPAMRKGLEKAVKDAYAIIVMSAQENSGRKVNGWQMPTVLKEYFGTDYLLRAAMAWLAIYVNSPKEAYYCSAFVDSEDKTLDGSKNRYILSFTKDELPPVGAFWSITMYDAKERYLVESPINRYAIGDRTEGLKYGDDGSLTIYLQKTSPGKDKESNWLPAPDEPFYLLFRMYEPSREVLNGRYKIPPVKRLN
jgi:hypothetical protein